ncbi:unnamed protein product, partial [Polarella glacialis]
ETLQQARDTTPRPDDACFGAALQACTDRSCWESALQIHAGVGRRRLMPDDVLLSMAIKACEAGQQWRSALATMTTCRQEAGFVYAAARSATIGAMQSADRSVKDLWQRALGMHSSFSEHFKRPPDAHSYTAAMESCAGGGQWQMAAELMRQLHSATSPFQRRDDESLAVGSGLTLQACAEANRWREALVLLVDVQVRRLQAHIAMYDAALASCETGPQSKGDVNEGLWQLAANLLTLARRQG